MQQLTNRLKPGQIHYLYLWVHPQWKAPFTNEGTDIEIEYYKEFVDTLKESPRVGLIQVADNPREEFMKNKVYTRFIEKLENFNGYAKEILDNRYLVWKESRFINAKNPYHVNKLIKYFNLIKIKQSDFVLEREQRLTKNPKYLAKISVFGKEIDVCSLDQASSCNLHDLASIVRHYYTETPELIKPPTITNPFPGDGEARYIFE